MIRTFVSLFLRLSKNSVIKNFSLVTLSTAITQILGIFVTVKIARFLNVEEYGVFSFLLVQGQLLITLGDLGIRNIVIRSIARDKSKTKDLIYNGLKLRLIGVISLITFYFVYNFLYGSLSNFQLFLITIFTLTSCFSSLFDAAYWGHEKMLTPAIISISFSGIWLTVIIFTDNYNANYLFSLFIILNIFKMLISYFALLINKILIGLTDNFFSSAKILLTEGWPYLLLTLIMVPSNYLTNNFLDINSSKEQVGYFNLSNKLMGPITMVLGISMSAIFPNLSALWSKSEDRFRLAVSNGFQYFVLIGVLITFLFSFLIKEVVIVLFTEKYIEAIKVCQLQIWYVLLMGINSFIGTVLGAMNKERLILVTGIINAIIAIPILFYSSYYGALGLSYGYLISFGLFEVYLWILFKRKTKIIIKSDLLIWTITILLFFFSYLFIDQIIFPIRLILGVMIVGFFIYLFVLLKNRNTIII